MLVNSAVLLYSKHCRRGTSTVSLASNFKGVGKGGGGGGAVGAEAPQDFKLSSGQTYLMVCCSS